MFKSVNFTNKNIRFHFNNSPFAVLLSNIIHLNFGYFIFCFVDLTLTMNNSICLQFDY
jgi:hypothetical protein